MTSRHSALVISDGFQPRRTDSGERVVVWETALSGSEVHRLHSREPVRVVYHTGSVRSRSSHRYPAEYNRQLGRQYYALSELTIDQYVEGRELYRQTGRVESSESVLRARRKFQRSLARDFRRLRAFDVEKARLAARNAVQGLAMLHEPDQGLGGPGQVGLDAQGHPIMGRDDVNSSIGPQNRANIDALDAAAYAARDMGWGGCCLNVELVLSNDPRLAQRLRRGRAELMPMPQGVAHPAIERGPPGVVTPQQVVTGNWPGGRPAPLPTVSAQSAVVAGHRQQAALIDIIKARAAQLQDQQPSTPSPAHRRRQAPTRDER